MFSFFLRHFEQVQMQVWLQTAAVRLLSPNIKTPCPCFLIYGKDIFFLTSVSAVCTVVKQTPLPIKLPLPLISEWFLRPTQDLAVLHRRQEVIRFFTSPQNSDVMSTLQSLLRNISNLPVCSLTIHQLSSSLANALLKCAALVCMRIFCAGCLSRTPTRPTGRASTRSERRTELTATW